MQISNTDTGFGPALPFRMPYAPMSAQSIVVDEAEWRALPDDVAATEPKVMATRWQAVTGPAQERESDTADDRHVIKIVLRSMNIRLAVAGRTVQDGVATPGTVHVTEAGAPVRCLFRGPYDVLHLHVPNGMIAECAGEEPDGPTPSLHAAGTPTRDATVERLGRALLDADEFGGSLGQIYADCVGIAIVTRLLAATRRSEMPQSKVAELAKWRLKRAFDYVEARLAEPVSLADLAASTGLTRMHFAAQFRAATGLRPHEYLLRRRVERAQELLAGTGRSVVDVALSVGFQTQAHFTAIFKRFAGQPPRAWRESQGC